MFVILWFMFAIVVGIGASSRGRNGFGWFILAAIISPLLAVILLALMPPLKIEADVIKSTATNIPVLSDVSSESVGVQSDLIVHSDESYQEGHLYIESRKRPWIGILIGLIILLMIGMWISNTAVAPTPTSNAARPPISAAPSSSLTEEGSMAVASPSSAHCDLFDGYRLGMTIEDFKKVQASQSQPPYYCKTDEDTIHCKTLVNINNGVVDATFHFYNFDGEKLTSVDGDFDDPLAFQQVKQAFIANFGKPDSIFEGCTLDDSNNGPHGCEGLLWGNDTKDIIVELSQHVGKPLHKINIMGIYSRAAYPDKVSACFTMKEVPASLTDKSDGLPSSMPPALTLNIPQQIAPVDASNNKDSTALGKPDTCQKPTDVRDITPPDESTINSQSSVTVYESPNSQCHAVTNLQPTYHVWAYKQTADGKWTLISFYEPNSQNSTGGWIETQNLSSF